MRTFTLLLTLLFILLLVAAGLQEHHAMVLIAIKSHSLSMSMTTAICLALGAFILFYLLIRSILYVLRFKHKITQRRRMNHARESRKLTDQAFISTIHGNWATAEKSLLKAIKLSKNPFIVQLIRIFLLNFSGRKNDVFDSLNLIRPQSENDQKTLLLFKSHLLMCNQSWEQAFTQLQSQHKSEPANPFITSLLANTCVRLKEWRCFESLIPQLKKNNMIPSQTLDDWLLSFFKHQLISTAKVNPDTIKQVWKEMPRHIRGLNEMKLCYLDALLISQQESEALQQLIYFLKKQWEPSLLMQLRRFESSPDESLLVQVDKWIQKHPSSKNECSLALAMLCIQAGRFARAKEILLSLESHSDPSETLFLSLAKVYSGEKNFEKAVLYYEKARSI